MIEYEDFSLKIEPKRGEVYPVIVLRSPAGEGRSSFRLPFDLDEAGDILFDLGQTVRRGGQASPAAARTPPQQVGHQLFQTLFSGRVRSLLDRSLGMIHGRGRGLRIKLHIDPEDPSLAQLASLPWEFLYRQGTRDFLNLSISTPIVRYLDVQRPYTPLPLEPPLRILVVISSPADYPALDLERERGLIEDSWAKLSDVRVEILERAHVLALQDRLAERPYHVLHYMGHGDFDARAGQGGLVMEDDGGDGYMVDGSALGVLLHDVPTMRLVFLNACETARVTKEGGLDPFAGVAAATVMAGIPAVVAMQFPISDGAAITFARRFYPLLARGYTVDAAVAEGRRAIYLAEGGTMEWGTPVLFMRAPQGVIFRVTGARTAPPPETPEVPPKVAKAPPKATEAPPEVDGALERRLAGLYTDGSSAFWTEDWERACRSFQAIVDQRPDYRDAAARLEKAERQRKLSALYAQAQAARETEDWPGAVSAFEELVAEEKSYKDAAATLEAVKKQKQLADLYAEARQLHRAGQWLAVIKVLERIETLDAAYPDPNELLASARAGLEAGEQARKLDALYSQGLQHMDAGEWSQAVRQFEEIQRLESGYQDTKALLARARRELAALEPEVHRPVTPMPVAPARKAGLPVWVWVVVGGVALLALFGGYMKVQGDKRATATAQAQATAAMASIADSGVRPKDSAVMVYVPAGEFTMGSLEGDDDEHPQHAVYLDAFWIDKTEVTNAQYRKCVEAGACEPSGCADVPGFNGDDQPVVCVDWFQATAYAGWVGGRLPTEAEWEKAARGTDGRQYPWGDEFDGSRLNYSSPGAARVGSYPTGASPYGALDMAGNVCEWVADWYGEDYYEDSPYENPTGPETGGSRVLRGGAFAFNERGARCACRFRSYPDRRLHFNGFRVVVAPGF